ncbi:MAG: pyruvate kinase [Anaerolineales bacterium]|nr:pyruvate kinase [Anaerolineales bacterium]
MLRTKIVCTIGPASREPDTLRELVRAGMRVARLNFSHGDTAVHEENIRRIREISAELQHPVAILVDLQGPKLRVGDMGDGVELETGETIRLTNRPVTGQSARADEPAVVPLQYATLPEMVQAGDRILMDDGLLEVRVLDSDGTDIRAEVVTGGLLKSNKGLNLPNASLAIPAITEKDWRDLAFALAQNVDWIALSFVRSAAEVQQLKQHIASQSEYGRPIPVIAKIEKPEALSCIDDIIAAADGIMVARGDLGIEVATERVPMIQKMLIRKCNAAGKPVITATQMLDSMIRNPRPTRAEASDVANAILDGTDAVMLSGETAAGAYPVRAVQTMVNIARDVESEQPEVWERPSYIQRPVATTTDAVSHATCETAADLRAAAIISATVTGRTAEMLARYRPPCPILAITPSPITQRRLMLFRGVEPLLGERGHTSREILDSALDAALKRSLIQEGDTVVMTAGISPNAPGSTNLMRVETVPVVLARGIGVLDRVVNGRVRRLDVPLDTTLADDLDPDEILVVPRSDRTLIPHLRRAAGLVTRDGSVGDHGYTLALELGIPAVVGVANGCDTLEDGQSITLDTKRGLVLSTQ